MFAFMKNKNYEVVNVNDLVDNSKKINLIDVREPGEYRMGRVPGAKNIPMRMLISEPEKFLKKDVNYHIICQSGARSARTCDALSAGGFTVTNVSGGTGYFVGQLER
ncbi:rhodanese-like domain-containing protein [Alkalibacter mobilis]|uniref:rhodanese-like domain-containing protein n=1 Tax=Alkalibacter mobilis TaxID=2787712 RepID=UPI00189E0F1B|nr:rhodanese-like domain-containing protein [Alkalibacter mobilis]MBF7097612.1 rhodanese-like domain-containing protein [Alkalibacter mobilis]